jgi:hypothetical protein
MKSVPLCDNLSMECVVVFARVARDLERLATNFAGECYGGPREDRMSEREGIISSKGRTFLASVRTLVLIEGAGVLEDRGTDITWKFLRGRLASAVRWCRGLLYWFLFWPTPILRDDNVRKFVECNT